MTFSRAGYTGAQKYPAHWAGDERSTFDAFKRSLIAGLSAGLSGVIMWGWDLAGFNGDIPTPELFIRSAQMAAFCPIMQYHAESKAEFNQDRTPWNIAERTQDERAISGYRFYANVRMNLLPYIVEQAKHSTSEGVPLMRAMVLQCPDDPKTYSMFDQYFFGDKLLVAPIIQEGEERRNVYLPGEKWVNIFTKKVYKGGQDIEIDAPLMEIPVFQRNNSCIVTNVSKENKSLGTYVGNSVDSFTYPLLHIISGKTFAYVGFDHLNEEWRVKVTYHDHNIVVLDVETRYKEFAILYTNTSSNWVNINFNKEVPNNIVFPDKTVLITSKK
jgi:alpha-glucosidase (family GH31 glycosyl hydrolase)